MSAEMTTNTINTILDELESRRERAEQAFIGVMNALGAYIAGKGFPLPKNELTVVDLGAGNMPYGSALERWASQQAEKARIIAVDEAYLKKDSCYFIPASRGGTRVEKLASTAEEAVPALKQIGAERIDLLTMFHPDLPLIKASAKPLEALCGSPLVGALFLDDLWQDLERGLSSTGYGLEFFRDSRSTAISESFVLPYSPLFVALKKDYRSLG